VETHRNLVVNAELFEGRHLKRCTHEKGIFRGAYSESGSVRVVAESFKELNQLS